MLKMQRLGVVLTPSTQNTHTVAKFNAGMALDGDIVHMAFRYAEWRPQADLTKESNYKVDEIRYARLTPTGELLYEAAQALIAPSKPWDNSGCQDARIVHIDNTWYLIYCGWDKNTAPPGQDMARVCIARTNDFVTAEKLGFIDHHTWDKDAMLFPERINGKIALLHRVEPNIQLEYFDTISQMLDPASWQNYHSRVEQSTIMQAQFPWECGKLGGSVPPIKTAAGWLFIYHAVENYPPGGEFKFSYRAGVALLDLDDPRQVIARLPYPILEPEEEYEQYGDVNNVVFPVGGYIYRDDLYISYGGADRVVALAKIPLAELLAELQKYRVQN